MARLATVKKLLASPGGDLAAAQLRSTALLREPLIRALRLEPTALDDLQTALQAYRAEYAAGRFGYVALNFTMP